ncbi:MAG: dicarboxylate/amino acid:cation symporter [Bacteroidales bacterium]|nr:dicarboxylate/amino acid:cation symporter [Bacteroidales bacterium]MDD3989154.1 dicarboxylate/amino acid:cation symporter [Bacteroidales bacterium]MDD4638598.1 dicarboxylate/amino acid:cation symporter [Bacteroidales bacterium]
MTKKFKLALHWQILLGVCLGIIFGIFFHQYTQYTKWLGDIFLRGLQMVVIPLVFSALVMGVSSIGESKDLGRIAGKTFAYYVTTTLIACILGLLLVNVFHPGIGLDLQFRESVTSVAATEVSFADQLISIVPDNVIKAMAEGKMLPVIFFAILFGYFITVSADKTRIRLTDLFNDIYEVMIKITFLVIRFAPFGLFGVASGMIGKQAGNPEALSSLFGSLGIYAAIIAGGCLIQGLGILPLIYLSLTRKNPFRLMKQMGTGLTTSVLTATSAASLPINLRDIQEKTGVSRKIAGFCLPLGNTINMNGTALFECVTAIFIAQVYGVELTLGEQIIVVLTSLLAAVGSAGIPLAGLVMLAVVLNAVGLPLEGIGLVLVVQQPLDMIRTGVNVWGDVTGAVIVAKSEGENLNI